MKRILNHRVFKAATAWLLLISMYLAMTSGGLTVLAADIGVTDYSGKTVTELLNSDENLTWVFAGDSITHNATFTAGMNSYAEWFEQYLYASGWDDDSVVISAWGGADVYDYQTKANTPDGSGTYDYPGLGLENCVTKYNPDVVCIKLGMNDRYKTTAEFTKYYKMMLDSIYEICKESYHKVPKIILLTPTPTSGESIYDDTAEGVTNELNWDSTLRLANAVVDIAAEYGLECVNLRAAFMNEQLRLGDDYFATFFRDPSDGGIHPNAAGQYMMLKAFAKSLGLDMEGEAVQHIFRYAYEDFEAGELFTDLTSNVIYTNIYDSVTAESNAVELLASVDFSQANGTFSNGGGTGFSACTTFDITEANSAVADPLTLGEVKSLEKEFTVVFRAKLAEAKNATQALLYISNSAADTKSEIAVHVPSTAESLYYKLVGTDGKEKHSKTISGNTFSMSSTLTSVDGEWHTIAIVQEENQMCYYIDGVLAHTVETYAKQDIGTLFADTGLVAHIGAMSSKEQGSFGMNSEMDWFQLYKGALTAEQVKTLYAGSGTFGTEEPELTADQVEMNKTMPDKLSTGTNAIASVEFNHTNGTFNNTAAFSLTSGCTDNLTADEVKALKREFSVVFRAKLNTATNATQTLLFVSDGTFTSKGAGAAIVLHAPSTKEQLFYRLSYLGSDGKTKYAHIQNGSSNSYTMSDTLASVGAWHTIAIVQEESQICYYIDGTLNATVDTYATQDIGSLFANLTDDSKLQADIGKTTGYQGSYGLNGCVDWFQLYGTALTAEQVKELASVSSEPETDESEETEKNQMDAVMPEAIQSESGTKNCESAYSWSDVATARGEDIWLVAGGSQLMGNDGTVVNRSMYRLIDNAIRRTGTYRGTRLVKTSDSLSTALENYTGSTTPLAFLYVPDLSAVYESNYSHSAEKVAAFKAEVKAWLDANEKAGVKSILWTPLASPDAAINAYISEYAEAVRELMAEGGKMLLFDANRFMNENLASNANLARNWFVDNEQLSALGARDVAYAFCMLSGKDDIAGSGAKDELAQHDLRASTDTCLFKGEYIRDNIVSAVSVSGTAVTVDVSGILAIYPKATDFTFKVLPYAHASSYNADLYDVQTTADGNRYTFTAPCTDPIIAVFATVDGKEYRFADVQASVAAEDIRYPAGNPDGAYLDSLEVVGAAQFLFNKNTTSYDVELYSYQKFVQILATAQNGLTITVNGEEVQSGENSGLITVESTKTVTVVVSGQVNGKEERKTYTLNLTRPSYPDIIITEVMTDAEYKTGNGGDDYEMIEIYNTTDRELNLKDYSIGYKCDYRYTPLKAVEEYPTFYFTGDNQVFGSHSDQSRTYTGINQITKYSSYWDNGDVTEPDYIAFPANSTMVIWVKFLDSTMTYDTLISDLKAAGENYTLKVNGEYVVPDQDQLVVAEVPSSVTADSKVYMSAVTPAASVWKNFYLNGFTAEDPSTTKNSGHTRGWLFVLDKNAQRDDNASITAAGNDIISAAKFVRIGSTHKLSSVFSYNTERGMSLVKNENNWSTDVTTGHTSDQQGYANKTSFGAIEYWQKPYDLDDSTAPTVQNNSPAWVYSGSEASIQLALSDDTDVRYLELYVKIGGEWIKVSKDFVLEAGMKNKGVSADIKSAAFAYDLGVITEDVQYYGYVVDGNQNKTYIATEENPCTLHASEGGKLDVKIDCNVGTTKANVTVTVEKGDAEEDLKQSYDVMLGSEVVGELTLVDGKLSGTFTVSSEKDLIVKGLPTGAKYTVRIQTPKGYELMSEQVYAGVFTRDVTSGVSFALSRTLPTGSLNIDMSIVDPDGEACEEVSATVTVTVENGEFASSYDVTKNSEVIGKLTLVDGKLTGKFELKHGETLMILGLPDGVTYTVTMTVPDKYEALSGSSVSDTLRADGVSWIAMELKALSGNLNVIAGITDVEGNAADGVSTDIAITIEKGDAVIDFKDHYDITNGAEKIGELKLEGGKLTGIISARNGDVLHISNLPEGTVYTVTAALPKGYLLEEEATKGVISSENDSNVLLKLYPKDPVSGNLKIDISIADLDGNAAADTVKAKLSILVEKADALVNMTQAYEIWNGDQKVGILSLRDGNLSGTVLVENGDQLQIKGLPEYAKFTVKLTVPDGCVLTSGQEETTGDLVGEQTAQVALALQQQEVTEEPETDTNSGEQTPGNDTGNASSGTAGDSTGNTGAGTGTNSADKSESPNTGDSIAVGQWLMLLFAAMSAVIVCLWQSKQDWELNRK